MKKMKCQNVGVLDKSFSFSIQCVCTFFLDGKAMKGEDLAL